MSAKTKTTLSWILVAVLFLGIALTAVALFMKEECEHVYEDGICTECGDEKTIDNETADLKSIGYDFRLMSDGMIMSTAYTWSMPAQTTATTMSTRSISSSYFDYYVTGTYDVLVSYPDNDDGPYGSDEIFSWELYFDNVRVAYSSGSGGYYYVESGNSDYTLADTSVLVTFDRLVNHFGFVPDKNYDVILKYKIAMWDDQDAEFEVYENWTQETVTLGQWSYRVGEELPEVPVKVGYTFSGWYTDEACTNLYTDDKLYGNITLYAGFVANNYTINFNANGGNGTMSALAMTYDQSKSLTNNTFTRSGYVFAGWATSANGSVAYANGAAVKNLTSEANGSVTLYAVWEDLQYIVTFNANGGNGTMQNMAFVGNEQKNLSKNAFVKTGYHFMGWATSANGSVVYTDGAKVGALTQTNNATINLYAVWAINEYTVVFVDGDTNVQTSKVKHGNTVTMPETAPSKEGHTFVGWAFPNGNVYNGQAITGDTTLTAKYDVNQVVVTFVIDGEATLVYVDWGTNLKELLDQYYPVALYDRAEEYDSNF